MIHNRNIPQQAQPGIAFGGDGSGVMVMGEQLREVNAPIEGLVGAGNSAIQGLMLSMIGSAAVTAAKSEERVTIPLIMKGASNHIGVILGVTAAASALGGFVRYARAAKHNEWSQKHYDFLHEQNAEKQPEAVKSFFEREKHDGKPRDTARNFAGEEENTNQWDQWETESNFSGRGRKNGKHQESAKSFSGREEERKSHPADKEVGA